MKKSSLTFLILLILCSVSFGQNTKDFNIKYMSQGCVYAKSSIKNSTELGGYARSENSPKIIIDSLNFSESGVFLKIDTSNIVSISEKYNAYKLFIGNQSDSILLLEASDSRLPVIAEVFYHKKWQAIEYLPSSWCGNSYHTVSLNMNEYWSCKIPKFSGKINTKIRYRLMISKGKYVYSNEISTSINKKQLTEKKGHK